MINDKDRSGDGFLTAVRVRHIYADCYREERHTVKVAKVTAWLCAHTLSDSRLYKYREDVIRMLLSLKPEARVDEKGGMSVAVMTYRGDNTQWTDDMSDIDKLIALGMAMGLLSFCAPRDKWPALPGGLPYVRIEITRFGVKLN